MRSSYSLLSLSALAIATLTLGCLTGGSGIDIPATPTPVAQVAVVRSEPTAAATGGSATPVPSPTPLSVLPALSTYIVRSGDYPMLIAENAGIPADQRDAWINEMLALNGVDATSLQIDQELILPPLSDGTAPVVTITERDENEAADPPAAVLDPVVSPTSTPGVGSGGVPFAATPPRLGFATETPMPTATSAAPPPSTPPPTAVPTGQRAWLTSSYEEAKFYYCDLDAAWQSIPAENLQVFDSEQQLLAVWGRFRTKAPNSVC